MDREKDVDVGIWVKFALLFITLACMSMCSNTLLIQEEVRAIKEHIVKTGE